MRVKMGQVWFTVRPDRPLAVELTETEKKQIAEMPGGQNRYAVFTSIDKATPEERLKWLQEG